MVGPGTAVIRRVPSEDFRSDGSNGVAAEVKRIPVDRFKSGQRRVVLIRVDRVEGQLNLLKTFV
jgi:hypothetical protein